MKVIVYLDFLNKDSYELVKELIAINKSQDIDVEIIGYDYAQSDKINNAYYGFNYANKYGVGLSYLDILLHKHHVVGLDINNRDNVAAAFAELGYEKHDMLDALYEGDYKLMQDYLNYRSQSNKVAADIYAFVYDDEYTKKLVIGKDEILALFA